MPRIDIPEGDGGDAVQVWMLRPEMGAAVAKLSELAGQLPAGVSPLPDLAASPPVSEPPPVSEVPTPDRAPSPWEPLPRCEPAAADLKKYGLDKPDTAVTLNLGSAKATLLVGGKADDGTVYAKDASKPIGMAVRRQS